MIEVELPDGKILEIQTDDPAAAASAAKKFMGIPDQPAPVAAEAPVERAETVGGAFQKLAENPPSGLSLVGMLKHLVTTPTRTMDSLQAVQDTAPPQQGTWTEEDQFRHNLAQGNLVGSALDVAAFGPMSRATLAVKPPATVPAQVPALPKPSAQPTVAEAAGNINVALPRVLATESVPVQRAGAAISQAPLVGEPLVTAARKTTQGLGEAASRVERELGAGSAETAGAAAGRDLSAWIKKTSRDEEGAAHEAVKDMITPNVITPLRNTAEVLFGINAKRVNAALAESPIGKILEGALSRPGMNYAGIKDLRTSFGPKARSDLIQRGVDLTEAKQIYGALSRDLEQAVLRAGGSKALDAWKRANAESVRIIGEQKRLSNIVGVKGDVTAEKVFERVAAMAASTQRADMQGLILAKKAMTPEAWSEIGSAIVARMGRDAQGAFSAERFLGPNGYGRLSNGAKGVLFSKEHRNALDDIATVSAAIKDKISQFENRSRTGGTVIGAAGLSGLMIDPITTIASAVGGHVLARYLAQPVTAKALAKVVKTHQQAIEKPSKVTELLTNAALRNLLMIGADERSRQPAPAR